MATKKVLGRGLGAFFPEYKDENSPEKKSEQDNSGSVEGIERTILPPEERVNIVLSVPVAHIRPNPHQPRKEFSEDSLAELAGSIQTHGLIQPITVRYLGEKRFELISGERRLRAAKQAGMQEIPAYIREADDEQSMAFALIENIQREELNPLEVALGYKRLLDEFDYTQAQVADKVGKNRSTVANMLRLLGLPDFVQKSLKLNQISMGHARALLAVDDQKVQKKVMEKAIKQEWSVRQIEDAIKKLSEPTGKSKGTIESKKSDENDPFLKDISSRLRRTFGTRVSMQSTKKGGQIKIEYYSDEDLDRILSLIDQID